MYILCHTFLNGNACLLYISNEANFRDWLVRSSNPSTRYFFLVINLNYWFKRLNKNKKQGMESFLHVFGVVSFITMITELIHKNSIPKYSHTARNICLLGRDPWSSGYGRRLMSWWSWVWIPAPFLYWMDIFAHIFVVKIVMFSWKDKNKRKRGRGLPM